MLRLIGVSALAELVAVAPSSSQIVAVSDRQLVVGKYHFEETGLKVDVDLNADFTACYQVNAAARWLWSVREGRVHVYSKPDPVRLEQAGAPTPVQKVALRVVAQLPDGSRAEGLGITWPNAARS